MDCVKEFELVEVGATAARCHLYYASVVVFERLKAHNVKRLQILSE
jgi:hypothetical protein